MKLLFLLFAVVACIIATTNAALLPSPFSITDFNPKTIGYLGDYVTVTGTGFTARRGIVRCGAPTNGVGTNYTAIVISNTTLLCPLRMKSVGSGTATTRTSSIYVWINSTTYNPSKSVATITQNDNLKPVISNVYIQPSGGAPRRSYINLCSDTSAATTLIIEGSYLGIDKTDINYLSIGLAPSASITITPSTGFISINSSRVVARLPTVSTIPVFAATSIYYGYGGSLSTLYSQSSATLQISSTNKCLQITSFTPTTIPQQGDLVTITGSGFTSYSSILCAAQAGSTTGRSVTVINDYTIICPLGVGSVGYGYRAGNDIRGDYITLWQSSVQSTTIQTATTQIVQNDWLKAEITNAYILWDFDYADSWHGGNARNYLSSCQAGEQQYMVVEGNYLGFDISTMFWFALGDPTNAPPPFGFGSVYAMIDGPSTILSYNQNQIVLQVLDLWQYSDGFPDASLYYSWGELGVNYAQFPDPSNPLNPNNHYIKGCVADEVEAPGFCSPVTC